MNSPRVIDDHKQADLIVRRLLAVKSSEQVAIVCDPHTEMLMAHALAGIVESIGYSRRSHAAKEEAAPHA